MTAKSGLSTAAVVHSADGIRFVATAASPDALLARLAAYVRGRCDDMLWTDAARQVRALLDDGDLHAAITRYFERTGERWDRERLELVPMEDGEHWTPDEARLAHARR
jgi:hypothetical protein